VAVAPAFNDSATDLSGLHWVHCLSSLAMAFSFIQSNIRKCSSSCPLFLFLCLMKHVTVIGKIKDSKRIAQSYLATSNLNIMSIVTG